MTTQVGIKELRDGLSRYVGDVHDTGRVLIITDRGKPIAKIVPLESWDERYARMVAEGAITPAADPRAPIPPAPVALGTGPTIAEIVVEQRG